MFAEPCKRHAAFGRKVEHCGHDFDQRGLRRPSGSADGSGAGATALPGSVPTPESYRDFIRGSKAEFGVAKTGYVHSRSGWFSDRSACYLASGRPVIAQETGFSRDLPTGEGLFAFQSTDDVVGAIATMNADYARHSRAARRIAEEYFESGKILRRLLDAIGAG